jgi:hypothetical protein
MPGRRVIKIPISRDEEWLCLSTAYKRIGRLDFSPDHESRKDRGLTLFEYVMQVAQSIGAEIAVAKYFAIPDFTPTVDTFKREADVGSQLEVKWTLWQDGHLILNGSDRREDVAILVVNKAPNYVPCRLDTNMRWLCVRSTFEAMDLTGYHRQTFNRSRI